MSGSKRRRKSNKNKKEKNDASPDKVRELIEPQSNQAFQQPEVQIGNKFDGNFESILETDMECKTEPEWVKDESYFESIQEIDLGCNNEPEWLVDESHGDKLFVSSPEGRLFSFNSRSSKVCWSVSTGIAPHALYKHLNKGWLEMFSEVCMSHKPLDVEVMFTNAGTRYVVCSTSVTKRHVIPRWVSLLSPLTSYSVQKLKEATTDTPSDITLCIKLFDYHLTLYRPGTNIIELKLRHATSIISIVSRDAVRWHEKNDVPGRQGQYLLTPGTHGNVIWSGKVNRKDDKDTVLVGEHNLGIDVICIKKSSDYDVEEEVSIVKDVSNRNLYVRKVYDVVSFQDIYKVTTERCDKGLRERLRELILSSCNYQKILLKLIRGIVAGLIGLHDQGIFLGNLDISNIFVDKDSNVKISVISEKTKFPLISSSKAATGDMLALGRLIFFILAGVEYHNEDLTKPIPSNDYLNPIYDNPEALDLLRNLLIEVSASRQTALQVWNHPLLWDPSKKINFIWTVSEHLETEHPNSELSSAINLLRPIVFGKSWGELLDVELRNAVQNGARTKYDDNFEYCLMHYLIRFIRNLKTHKSTITDAITSMQKVQPVPSDVCEMFRTGEFGSYLFNKFPKLVMELYNIMKEKFEEDIKFSDYFKAVLDN